MNIQTRLKKLEASALPASSDGLCSCPVTELIVYYPGKEPPADMPLVETCDVCGGEMRVRKIELIDRHDDSSARRFVRCGHRACMARE
jgi:hypothetical protein